MPFRIFALIVIAVLATAAASIWLAAAVAVHLHVAPVPFFGMIATLLIAASLIVRKRHG